MSHAIKLYDKNGNHVISCEPFQNQVAELTAYNKKGLYIKAQFNKARTKVVSSYADYKIVTNEQFNDPFNKIQS